MKVLTTCGMGFGTSLMLLMELQTIGKKHGIVVEGEAVDVSSVKGRSAELIVGSSEIVNELTDLPIPVIGISNILDKAELESKFLEFLLSKDDQRDQS